MEGVRDVETGLDTAQFRVEAKIQRHGEEFRRVTLEAVKDRRSTLEYSFSPWKPLTLHELLDFAAERHGDAPYFITDAESWSYRQMADWSAKIAAGLLATGIEPGDKVAVILANYPEFAALKFAISRVGAIAVPINMLNRRDEICYLLQQSDTRLLVTMDCFRGNDYLAALDEISPDWANQGGGITLPLLESVVVFNTGEIEGRADARHFASLLADPPAEFAPVRPDAVCDIIYTSGTTGAPKGVELTHDMLTRTAFGAAYGRAFAAGQRIVFSLPMYHVFGYIEGLLAVPWVGGAVVPRLRFDPHDTLAAIERTRATDALLIPTMTLAVIDALQECEYDLSSLQFVLASGGRAPDRIWRAIYDVLGVTEITTGYGMTETTATTTQTRPDDPAERISGTNGRGRDVGPAGDPALDGKLVTYKVIDPETGVTLPAGETGELVAKGLGVTAGYYRKPDATAAAFTADGWLRTGDLGRFDKDGYLNLMGRSKESYRCGGELVMPTEVEDILTGHPNIIQAHVVPIPDERMGEVGVAFVVTTEGHKADLEALRQLVSGRVARFKVPRHFLQVDAAEIPTTASGRARKFMLTARALEILELT